MSMGLNPLTPKGNHRHRQPVSADTGKRACVDLAANSAKSVVPSTTSNVSPDLRSEEKIIAGGSQFAVDLQLSRRYTDSQSTAAGFPPVPGEVFCGAAGVVSRLVDRTLAMSPPRIEFRPQGHPRRGSRLITVTAKGSDDPEAPAL